MTITYKKALEYQSIIVALLNSNSLTWEQRKALTKAKISIEDATTGTKAKVAQISEMFSIMKGHDKYTKNAEELELLVKKTQKDNELITQESIELKHESFDFVQDFSEDKEQESKDYRTLSFYLDGIIFDYKQD